MKKRELTLRDLLVFVLVFSLLLGNVGVFEKKTVRASEVTNSGIITDDIYGTYSMNGSEMTIYEAVLNSDNCIQGDNGFVFLIRGDYTYLTDAENGIYSPCTKVIFAEGAIPETYTDNSGASWPITMVEILEIAETPEFVVGAYELNLTDTVKTVRNRSSTPVTINGSAELWVGWAETIGSSEVDFSLVYSGEFDSENGLAKPGSTITVGTVEKINEDGTSTLYSLGNMDFYNFVMTKKAPQELLDTYVKHYADGTKIITVPNIASAFSASGQQIEVISIDSLAENKYADYITLDGSTPSVLEGRDWYNAEFSLNARADELFNEYGEKYVYEICELEDGNNTEGNWQTGVTVTSEGQDIAKTYVLIDKSVSGIDNDDDGSYEGLRYSDHYGKIIYLNYTYTMDLETPKITEVKATDSSGKEIALSGKWQETDNTVTPETAWTNDPLLLFYVEADAGTGTALSQYGFQFPGETDFTWITSQEKEYEFEADGTYNVYFRVMDLYDEKIEDRGASGMWAAQVGIDTIAPVLEYVDNIAVQGGILTDNSICEGRLNLTGYDENSGVNEVILYLEENGEWIQKEDVLVSNGTSGAYYIEPVSTDMVYRLAVTDMAGNETIYENITIKAAEVEILNDETGIPDVNLYNAIVTAADGILGDEKDNKLTVAEAESLESLLVTDAGIADLQGLQYCKNLGSLNLSSNQITDISIVGELERLYFLSLKNNQISDISPLAECNNLEELYLSENQITDIAAVSNLKKMTVLLLENNQINSIDAVADLVNLDRLWLTNNQIKDINAVAGLTNLTYLRLGDNQISDIADLTNLIKLEYLYLYNNQISDISALSGLINITHLDLSYNQITDASVLDSLTNAEIILDGNPIGLVTSINLSESSISLETGATLQFTATISPSDALNQTLEWTSTDTGVAQVDEHGMITAVAAGTTTITVTATDGSGVSASCEVTVTDTNQEVPIEPDTSEPEGDITTGVLIQTGGKVNIKSGVAYSLGSGNWKVLGDDTVYSGNITFYVSEDGEYEFTLQ